MEEQTSRQAASTEEKGSHEEASFMREMWGRCLGAVLDCSMLFYYRVVSEIFISGDALRLRYVNAVNCSDGILKTK